MCYDPTGTFRPNKFKMQFKRNSRIYKKVIILRGFGEQTVQTNLILLLEETGELAKAIRKTSAGMSVDPNRLQNYDTVESEVADVLIVLISICNTLSINLFDALVDKEKINSERNWNIDAKKN